MLFNTNLRLKAIATVAQQHLTPHTASRTPHAERLTPCILHPAPQTLNPKRETEIFLLLLHEITLNHGLDYRFTL
jgi:hypothetical protein